MPFLYEQTSNAIISCKDASFDECSRDTIISQFSETVFNLLSARFLISLRENHSREHLNCVSYKSKIDYFFLKSNHLYLALHCSLIQLFNLRIRDFYHFILLAVIGLWIFDQLNKKIQITVLHNFHKFFDILCVKKCSLFRLREGAGQAQLAG